LVGKNIKKKVETTGKSCGRRRNKMEETEKT
jgi:hypothetical protein